MCCTCGKLTKRLHRISIQKQRNGASHDSHALDTSMSRWWRNQRKLNNYFATQLVITITVRRRSRDGTPTETI